MNRRTTALCLFIITVAALSGCTTYTAKTENLKVSVTHHVRGDQIVLAAKILNHGPSSVTIINHPNYYTLSLKAVREKNAGYTSKGCILYEEPGPSAFVRLKPGEAITMDEQFRFRRTSKGVIEIFHPIFDDRNPSIRGHGPLLEGRFSYWGGREIPLFARIGLVNVYTGDLEAKTIFRGP